MFQGQAAEELMKKIGRLSRRLKENSGGSTFLEAKGRALDRGGSDQQTVSHPEKQSTEVKYSLVY